jgi:hypothetical protein
MEYRRDAIPAADKRKRTLKGSFWGTHVEDAQRDHAPKQLKKTKLMTQ